MRRPAIVASVWLIREGFREEVMAELGLEACVGFGTVAISISGARDSET